MIVRNEARDIAEWIAFHAEAGFDTQLIFDNLSTDGTDRIVRNAARHYDIRFHAWENQSARTQLLAYEAACTAYKLEFDWIAFIDSDEYLVTHTGEKINAMLARYDGWSAVAINWAIYGANGHEDFPEGLVTDNFTRRAEAGFFPNRHVKSIIRPRLAVACPSAHNFRMVEDRDGHYCDAAGNYMLWAIAPEVQGGVLRGVGRALPDYGTCRINHYFTRSRAHWMAKLSRGYASQWIHRDMSAFDEHNRNEVEDPIANRWSDRLQQAVGRLSAPVPA
jgi:glycosyltransferase involved in cell wall biosynthesis